MSCKGQLLSLYANTTVSTISGYMSSRNLYRNLYRGILNKRLLPIFEV